MPRPVLLCVAAVLLCLYWAGAAGTALVISRPILSPDVIVSLASHEWERLPVTASLAAEYPASIVLLTLPIEATNHNCEDCGGRVARLGRAGVSSSRVRVTPLPAANTYDEAIACREYIHGTSARKLLVVTSPYHARRALATFRKVFAGIPVVIGIQPALTHSPAQPASWWRQPYDRRYVVYEWAATMYYAVRYGIVANGETGETIVASGGA